jgi:hypothetical protein
LIIPILDSHFHGNDIKRENDFPNNAGIAGGRKGLDTFLGN